MLNKNKNFENIMKKLNSEYNDVILHNFNKNIRNFHFIDIADYHSKDTVTYGDSKIDSDGKEVPIDLILTADYEYLSRQYLDYVFEFKSKSESEENDGKLTIDAESLTIEKFFVKDMLEKGFIK